MLDILLDIEQMAGRLRPIVLIGPGLAAIMVGLFIWLGGLRFVRILFVVLGAVGAGICGFFVVGRSIITVVGLVVVPFLIAVLPHRIFITIFAAGLTAILTFVVLTVLYQDMIELPDWPATRDKEASDQDAAFSVSPSDFGTRIKQICLEMPVLTWLIILVVMLIAMVGGFCLWRFASALYCAVLGTVLIFAGMILLLLYKGSAPVSTICDRPLFYAGIFAAMTAFGTGEQLLLCPYPKRKAIGKKEAKKPKTARDKRNWRTG
jgi:hypothetical protein